MPFFSNVSGVNILGRTFYSAAQGINIHDNVQLATQENESHSLAGLAVDGRDAFQKASSTEHDDGRSEGSVTSGLFRYGTY